MYAFRFVDVLDFSGECCVDGDGDGDGETASLETIFGVKILPLNVTDISLSKDILSTN